MYIHIGLDKIIRDSEITGVFDLDTSTVSKITRDYLALSQKEGRVIDVCKDLPKSFIICKDKKGRETVYITQLSSSTIIKRTLK